MRDVTVVVPSYNHEPFIERTLRSVFAQTLPPKRLIVIDDGSKDESVKIIGKALKDCTFEHLFIQRENRGLSATLNQAFSLSDSEFFAYIGSDDTWRPEYLAQRVGLLSDRADAVLAFGHAFLIDEQDRITDCTKDWKRFADGDVLQNLLNGVVPVTSGVVFRSAALHGLSWNEDAILEDYELYLRLAVRGAFAASDDVLISWRQHSYNASRDYGTMLNEWLAAQNRVAAEIGITSEQLKISQRRLKFVSVANFLRQDKKAEAIKMLRENWNGSNSLLELGKIFIRTLLPLRAHKVLRDRRRRKQMLKYGSHGLDPRCEYKP